MTAYPSYLMNNINLNHFNNPQGLEGLNLFNNNNNDLNMNHLDNPLLNNNNFEGMNFNNFADNDYQLELNDFHNNQENNDF